MAQKKDVYKATLKQVGYWSYKELYNMTFNWLKDHDYDVQEDKYEDKSSADGKEIIIRWIGKKKVTDYFKYHIQLDWHILRMNDAEVEVDGKKIKMNKGEVKIEFKGTLIKDYEKRWQDKPVHKFLRSMYEKYIIREAIEEYENDLKDDTKEMIKDTKAFLRIPAQ